MTDKFRPPIRFFRMYPELEEISAPQIARKMNEKEKRRFYPSTFHALVHDDNPWLLTGYRKLPVDCFKRCLSSVLTLHNDSVNIWSHLLGAMYLTWLWWSAWTEMVSLGTDLEDRIAFSLNLLGTVVTFLISATYHTLRAHSEFVYHFCLACDLRGICLMTAVGNAMTITLTMRFFPHWRTIYLTLNFIALVSLNLWIPRMVRLRLTHQRTLYFSLHAGMAAFCWLHRYLLTADPAYTGGFHLEEKVKLEQLGHLVLSYTFIGVALFIKVLHIPERWFPKIFDLFGASHQLFHVITTTGAIISHNYVMDMLRNGSFPSIWKTIH